MSSTTSRVRPIETSYAGCRFRSRLEARWAVFFDALDIPWDYEPQGFEVGGDEVHVPGHTPNHGDDRVGHDACHRPDHGTPPIRYLPDFWLPSLKLWAEVKGDLRRVDLHTLCLAVNPPKRGGLPFAGPDGGSEPGDSPNRLRLLILAGIPRLNPDPSTVPAHWALRWVSTGGSVSTDPHKGEILAETWVWKIDPESGDPLLGPTSSPAQTVWRHDGGAGIAAGGLTLPFTTPLLARITRADDHARIGAGPWTDRARSAYLRARSARFEFGQTPRARQRRSPAAGRR